MGCAIDPALVERATVGVKVQAIVVEGAVDPVEEVLLLGGEVAVGAAGSDEPIHAIEVDLVQVIG